MIDRVFEEDEQLLRFFHDEGIRPGQYVQLKNVAPYRGTVTVEVGESPGDDSQEVVMGTQVARLIWVKAPAGSERGRQATIFARQPCGGSIVPAMRR
ncbi:MAG: FeoA family protein [Dehalococcoidia bacterium]|nr:FeoA family protein [Dehalococcoidia bacterium]